MVSFRHRKRRSQGAIDGELLDAIRAYVETGEFRSVGYDAIELEGAPLPETTRMRSTLGALEAKGPAEPAPAHTAHPQARERRTLFPEEQRQIERIIDQPEETFTEMLLRIIDEQGLRDADVYRRAQIDRRLFSKIRSDTAYRPSKKTVLALCIALRLPLDEAEGLLMKAGFALSDSSKQDLIVRYFIIERLYDLQTVNEALYAFNQPLLS